MVKLGIVGNVAIDRRQGELAWHLISGLISVWTPREIWSGGATGIDSVAATVAGNYGYHDDEHYQEGWSLGRLVVCLPDVQAWDPVGRRGFKARNMEIVNGVDRLVRISKHDNGDRTYGSGWTADRAEDRLGEENVFRYYI